MARVVGRVPILPGRPPPHERWPGAGQAVEEAKVPMALEPSLCYYHWGSRKWPRIRERRKNATLRSCCLRMAPACGEEVVLVSTSSARHHRAARGARGVGSR